MSETISFDPRHPPVRFPVPEPGDGDIVAAGGDLSPVFLLSAYAQGAFPWTSDEELQLWWDLDPRFVLLPAELHVSRRLARFLKKGNYDITVDRDFAGVIASCRSVPRPGQDGTWITREMEEAYRELHRLGYAHSVETRREGRLIGGLYGVSLGGVFYGESMFARESDASKAAMVALTGVLSDRGFPMIDCQQPTRHLGSLGAREIPREEFHVRLSEALTIPTLRGDWSQMMPGFPASSLWTGLTGGGGEA